MREFSPEERKKSLLCSRLRRYMVGEWMGFACLTWFHNHAHHSRQEIQCTCGLTVGFLTQQGRGCSDGPYALPPSNFASFSRSNPITTSPLINVTGVEKTPSSCSSFSADSSSAISRSSNSIPCSESHAFSRWQKCQPGWVNKITFR